MHIVKLLERIDHAIDVYVDWEEAWEKLLAGWRAELNVQPVDA